MAKSGGLDAENLWITSQRTWLPTLGKHSIAKPLLVGLDQQIRCFPGVLRECIKTAADGAPKRRLIAIGLFENIHHKNRLNPRGLFAEAGYEVYDPHEELAKKFGAHAIKRKLSRNEADEFMKNKIAMLSADGVAHNDTCLVIGTSDEFASATAQVALETNPRRVVIVNHYVNSRQQRKKVKELSVYGSRFRVCCLEELKDYRDYASSCLAVDPHHKTWCGMGLSRKIFANAVLRVSVRDHAYERYVREGGDRPIRPVEEFEFKRWLQEWVDSWNSYNQLAGVSLHSNEPADVDAAYRSLLKDKVIEEKKMPELNRGHARIFVRLSSSPPASVTQAIESIKQNRFSYELDNHTQS